MIIQILLKQFSVIMQKMVLIIMVNVENLTEFQLPPLHPPPTLRAAVAAALPVISLHTVVVL
jgi:hypothetical protein